MSSASPPTSLSAQTSQLPTSTPPGGDCPQSWWKPHPVAWTDLCERGAEMMKKVIDGPVAQLILDLEERGLLNRTLVVLASEFSRDAVTEGKVGKEVKDQANTPDVAETRANAIQNTGAARWRKPGPQMRQNAPAPCGRPVGGISGWFPPLVSPTSSTCCLNEWKSALHSPGWPPPLCAAGLL